MYFSRSALIALLSAPLAVWAQTTTAGTSFSTLQNPFKIPSQGLSATAGQDLDLAWTPTTQGTVSLVLRSGASSDLTEGTIIASNIDNSGKYTWNVPTDITRGSDYAIEIIDDDHPDTVTNYTPYFVLDSDVVTAQSTAQVTMGAPTTSLSAAPTLTPTGSASDYFSTVSSTGAASTTATATVTVSGSSAVGASTSALASGASSAPGSMITSMSGSAASGSSSGSASATGSSENGSSSADQTSSGSGAGFQGSSTGSAAATQTANSASKPTAMAGMIGMIALGALAL